MKIHNKYQNYLIFQLTENGQTGPNGPNALIPVGDLVLKPALGHAPTLLLNMEVITVKEILRNQDLATVI